MNGVAWAERTMTRARFKIAALIIWLLGVWTTWAFVRGLLPLSETTTLVIALVAQFALSVAQSDFWRGERGFIPVLAVVFDAAANAAGLWPIMQRIGQTNAWQIARDAGIPASAEFEVAVGVTILLALVIAGAPERLWRDG